MRKLRNAKRNMPLNRPCPKKLDMFLTDSEQILMGFPLALLYSPYVVQTQKRLCIAYSMIVSMQVCKGYHTVR